MEIVFQASSKHDSVRQRSALRCRIDDGGLAITRRADSTLCVDPAGVGHSGDEITGHIALILPHGDGELRSAVMLLPSELGQASSVLLDGYPPLAVSELADGAEISIGADSMVYHETRRALTEIFAGKEVDHCARCRRLLEQGDSIRRCGTCLSPHHEGPRANPERPHLLCASYDPACGRCGVRFETTPSTEDEHDGH